MTPTEKTGKLRNKHNSKIKICLVYPNVYQVSITNVEFNRLYRFFNERRDLICERSFLPSLQEIKEYKNGLPLFSCETKKTLYEFDIIVFSLDFENEYPNIIKILDLSKIVPLVRERQYQNPLLIAVGCSCFFNPEPVSNIFDIIFIGETEELMKSFLSIYKEVRKDSYEEDFKNNLKEELLKFNGFYIPEAYIEIYDLKGKLKEKRNIWINAPRKIKSVFFQDKYQESFPAKNFLISSNVYSISESSVLSYGKTLVLVPETGSDRLRRIIKKELSNEELLLILDKIYRNEIENLRLYLKIGLPFESESDIDEIIRFLGKTREKFHGNITANIRVFIPKPFTAFQWHKMEYYEVVKERLKKLKKDTAKIKGLTLVHEVPKYSYMEGYFSRADRRGLLIIQRVSKGENFGKIFEEIKDELYEIKNFDDYLPWDFIEHQGITRENLWEEYKKAEVEANK